jgi:tetratricopeptide (TPR) repeat protein
MKLINIFFITTLLLFADNSNDIYSQIDEHTNNFRYVKSSELAESWLKNNPNDVEALWRSARAHFDIADGSEDPTVHKEHFYPGLESAKKALNLNPESARANHWYAVLIGKIGILEGTEQKIINSYEVKDFAEKAISLDPIYDGTYHLMGRWHFSISDLSWIERTIAGWVYTTPPDGSFKDAVEFFKKAINSKPDEIRHYVWLGKSYLKLGNKKEAKIAFENALKISPNDDSDRILLKQANELLANL